MSFKSNENRLRTQRQSCRPHGCRCRQNRRTGGAAVEFAMTAPILIIFLFAGFEFSRMNSIRNAADFAAVQAGREAMLPGATSSRCEAKAQDYLDMMRIRSANIDVTPTTITSLTPTVTVSIEVPLSQNMMPLSNFVMGKTMTHSVSVDREFVSLSQPGGGSGGSSGGGSSSGGGGDDDDDDD